VAEAAAAARAALQTGLHQQSSLWLVAAAAAAKAAAASFERCSWSSPAAAPAALWLWGLRDRLRSQQARLLLLQQRQMRPCKPR
jgi:hypothetical protein